MRPPLGHRFCSLYKNSTPIPCHLCVCDCSAVLCTGQSNKPRNQRNAVVHDHRSRVPGGRGGGGGPLRAIPGSGGATRTRTGPGGSLRHPRAREESQDQTGPSTLEKEIAAWCPWAEGGQDRRGRRGSGRRHRAQEQAQVSTHRQRRQRRSSRPFVFL